MSDYSELKRLAEALGGATWLLVDGDGFEADNRFVTSQQRIDDNKVAYAEINYGHPEAGMGEPFQSQQVTAGEFIAAANPAAVLELIAENERLRADYASLSTFNPDWDRVAAAQDSVREHMEIASKLRAENAGLKTGYEAYEAQNAALKGENEALRKHQPSAEVIWCACGDGRAANSYGAGFMDANNGVCENCDAAQPMISCPLELFETLRDSANTEADEHRQCMATYRPLRQENLDAVVKKCDDLLAAMGQGEQS